MKQKAYLIILFFGTITLANSKSINDQIETMKQATPQERIEIMNRLKMEIAAMNEEEQAMAFEELQGKIGGGRLQPRFGQQAQSMKEKSVTTQHTQRSQGSNSSPKQLQMHQRNSFPSKQQKGHP